MKTIKRIKKRKSLIRFIAMFVAAVLVFELMPYLSDHAELTAEAAQTLSEFEQSRWNSILGATFKEYTVTGNATPTPSSMISAYTVKNDSPYFHWHEASNDVPTWGSTTVTTVGSTQEQITYATDTVENGAGGSPITANAVNVIYKTYHVKNADEFVWVMNRANTGNTRIILDKDIDMGGTSGKKWSDDINLTGSNWFDLEGEGHKIYNFRMSKPLINSSKSNKKTIIRNVLFTNCLAFFANHYQGIVIGVIQSPVHLENVSVTDSLVYSDSENIGILIGRVDGYDGGNVFLKNCSTLRSYIYGKSHIGGMTACQFNRGGTYQVKYDTAFPTSPEAWMNYGNKAFPEMIENCYSVDCEVFSNGEDSGAFISCGCGFICRNCFTNNTMYGNKMTGDFIGRVVTASGPTAGLYDDINRLSIHETFINCFSSGSVEGAEKIGGFTAYQNSGNNQNSGTCVYINCYSTAMVGMEFAGKQLGGFIGHEDTYNKYEKQKPSVNLPNETLSNNYGDVYINCYAAGEVGNILTDTSTQATGDSLGGFLGDVSTSGNGTYYNCYYDKQTTAMRERACGQLNEFANKGVGNSQIPGVTGVYTQKSTAKNVKGLADNVCMSNDDTTWEYQNGFYPMLKVFIANDAFKTLFDDTRSKLVEEYARASVATVLLNHYDTILGSNGIERDANSDDATVYDTVRDITSKFELTTNDDLGITWGKDTEKNTSRGLADKFGGENGFSLDYKTVNQDEDDDWAYLPGEENERTITKKFTPDVLTIGRYDDPEDDRGYYYKCFDFAPGIQWLKVSAGDIENNVTGWDNSTNPTYTDTNLVGSRSFRLLPTAYLNAGDIMHINVETDNTTSPVTYTNTVTIAQGADENKINGLFNHSVGVEFAITDKYRMGTDNIYTPQSIQKFNGTGLTDNNTFAFYSGYAVNDANTEDTIDNVKKAKNIGSAPMVSQKFDIKNNNSSSAITNNSSNGTVRVRIFRANPKIIDTGGFYLEKGNEITYSGDTLAKWQGGKPFDTNDSNAYYYLDYYWRLNDGRYLFDRKLVRITADTYSVTMKTGLLDEQYTVNESVTPKTAVDQYVTDNITTNSDNTKTWDKDNLYPSKNGGFNAQTAPNYYEPDTYNKFEYINGNDYYTKTLKIDTARPQTAVGWMRASDYKLTALIVEAVDSNGIHHEMSRIDANNANDPLNFDNAEYTYDYKTYSVTQDSETKIFSVTENTTVTNTFSVETYSSEVTNGVSKFILFSFSTTGDISEGAFSEIKDSLIITALFRKNDANVKTEKQVLANTGDPITAVSDTIKTSTYDNNGVTQTQTYYSSIDVIDENKRVDDKGISDTDKRKAVLSGDTLTYRLKAYNAGYFTSREVNIYDDIPSGTTYVKDSAKLYRQKSLSTSHFDWYDELEFIDITDITSEKGYSIEYDPTSKRISADIPNIALDENYYLEYKVKVDDIKATDLSETITNKANYQFINFNGDTTDDFNDTNQNAAQAHAIVSMNVKHNENDQEYVVDFNRNDISSSNTYIIDSYTNVFPENFQFTANSVKVYDTSSEEAEDITGRVNITYENASGKCTGFTIKNTDNSNPTIKLDQNNKYQVKFKGTAAALTNSSHEIRNKATVTYTEGEGQDAKTKATAISIVERLTNQTETDVTHLYVDIDKIIPESDPAQTFLFKIERFDKDDMSDTPEICYTKINCTKQTEDNYTGSRLLQLDKRGYYRITEVDDWSNSDYLFDKITYTDISKVSGLTDSKTISTQNQSAVIQLPRQYNKDSLAFPTSFGGLQTASYPILKFTNKLNDYAYRTSQAYAENNIS